MLPCADEHRVGVEADDLRIAVQRVDQQTRRRADVRDNLRTRFRKPLLYPLSYGGVVGSR